jgi:Putative adhesin Stv domain
MGRVVFLGHGGFDPTTGSDVAVVLVPPGTSLKFFSDAGQALLLPTAAKGGSDYNKVVKVWDHFKEAENPVGPKGVTYNFSLAPETLQTERDLAMSLDWGAEVVTLPGDSKDFDLCTGTAQTCPTPKLNVAADRHDELVAMGDAAVQAFKDMLAAGSSELPPEIAGFKARLADVEPDHLQYVADGVPDDRWNHHCNGILTKHAGNELYWVACTSFMVETPDMPTLVTSDSPGPAARSLNWQPSAESLKVVRKANAEKVKAADNGGTLPLVAAGTVVLIGAEHAGGPAEWVRNQPDIEEGQLTVKKGGAFSKGAIEVQGISAKRALVTSEIGEFSDKKVTFA